MMNIVSMNRPELAQTVAREMTRRFGAASSEPSSASVRTSLPAYRKYQANLLVHQRFLDPVTEIPCLLAQGIPLCPTAQDVPLSAIFERLEDAARAEDVASFVRLAKQIDWQRASAEQFKQAIRYCLDIEAHMVGHTLAALAGEMFPSDPELSKLARVLAPPKFVGRRLASPDAAANRDWLDREGRKYRGQWVVLQKGNLLGHSQDIDDIRSLVKKDQGIFVTQVW